MALLRKVDPEASEATDLADNLDGCLYDIEFYLEKVQEQVDEARHYLRQLSK